MATYRLSTIGKKNETCTVLYDLTKDGTVLEKDVSYTDGFDKILSLSRTGDRHQEECSGKIYCDISAEELWEGHHKCEQTFARGDAERKKKNDEWLKSKLAGN